MSGCSQIKKRRISDGKAVELVTMPNTDGCKETIRILPFVLIAELRED